MINYSHTAAPHCKDSRPCRFKDYVDRCRILRESYKEDGKCPWCKSGKEKDEQNEFKKCDKIN